MRTQVLLLLISFLFSSGLQANSPDKESFTYDKERVQEKMQSLNQIKQKLKGTETKPVKNIDFEDQKFKEIKAEQKRQGFASIVLPDDGEKHGFGMQFLAFLSGFCCGIFGITATFYLSDKNATLTEASIIGSLVMTVLYFVSYLALIYSSTGTY